MSRVIDLKRELSELAEGAILRMPLIVELHVEIHQLMAENGLTSLEKGILLSQLNEFHSTSEILKILDKV